MGRQDIIDRGTNDAAIGCPSGLQTEPVAKSDPMGSKIDLSSYVNHPDADTNALELIVQGAHCSGCLGKIERGVSALPSVTSARMNLSTLRLKVSWTGEDLSASDIVSALSDLGFGAAPYDIDVAQTQSEGELKYLLRAIAVAGFAAMNVMMLSIAVWSGGADMSRATHTLFHWISAMIALPTVLYAGRPFFRSAWGALKNKQTNMDVPISLALVLACSLSVFETVMGNPDTYFDAAVMLLFLLLIGRYLDAKLRLRTGEAARRLAALQVTSATRLLANGKIETVPASAVSPGDHLLIPAGQRIPVDCRLIKGQSDIDMQIATGETAPQSVAIGDSLYSGTTNLTSPITVEVINAYSDSFLSEITSLVEAGEQKKSKFVRIADRAARAYVPVVHTIAALTFIGWLWIGGDLRTAALNAIAVLIITCPCALGLAVPAVQIVAAGRLFKHGVLIRSGDALERLAKTKWVIFDKTGTLTTGKFTLLNRDEISPSNLRIAAAMAKVSSHPMARALHDEVSGLEAADIIETAGAGLSAIVDERRVRFGSADFVGVETKGNSHNNSEIWMQTDDTAPVQFQFSDQPRKDAVATLDALRAQNLPLELLSGDRKQTVETVADNLGFSRWSGGVNPQQKMNVINQRLAEGRYPLMVGDGINDAPALSAANASASLATASDISRSTSDIILQGDKLIGLPKAIIIAQKAGRRVKENLGLAIIYNMLAIPLAIFGFVNPLVAALAMSGSSLIVTLNALRMSRA
ncbi:heavy metal translocating P-type ATPase [Fretibacter rubidus]|uniref:heavy metal translocating P-type ATPase n=1 Tax=Fretibacter rubidus TaxID=570162 RepID=UPI00352B9196